MRPVPLFHCGGQVIGWLDKVCIDTVEFGVKKWKQAPQCTLLEVVGGIQASQHSAGQRPAKRGGLARARDRTVALSHMQLSRTTQHLPVVVQLSTSSRQYIRTAYTTHIRIRISSTNDSGFKRCQIHSHRYLFIHLLNRSMARVVRSSCCTCSRPFIIQTTSAASSIMCL